MSLAKLRIKALPRWGDEDRVGREEAELSLLQEPCPQFHERLQPIPGVSLLVTADGGTPSQEDNTEKKCLSKCVQLGDLYESTCAVVERTLG